MRNENEAKPFCYTGRMNKSDYRQFTVKFPEQAVVELYSDWKGLFDLQTIIQPLLMSSFGDLLYKDPHGAVHFLDTLEGTITQFAKDESEMQIKLNDENNQNHYLSSENVMLLRERGLVLTDDELYIYVPHPSLTGSVDLNTVQIMSMRIVLSLNGQSLG